MDKREIRFDGWSVDFVSGELTRDGATHRLQDQPLQILDELLKHPGEVVTREQLIARLWPKGVVEFDTGLNSAMRKLRIALGDDADTPRYIETLPRKGYRFVGRLEPSAPVPGVPTLPDHYVPTIFETGAVIGRRATDRRAPLMRLILGFGSIVAAIVLAVVAWHMPGGAFTGATAAPKLPTIVVLPLVDMSVGQSEQALCDGLTDELSNWLAHIPTLRVVARTSAFAFKDQNTDVRQIADALGATHVLEGSLRRSGSELRITVQLIEAEYGLHIWSKSFDLPIGNIFQIEDTVARSVAEALHLTLAADTTDQWAQRQPTTMEAYELYLLGRARQRKRTAEDNLKAEAFFERAIARDPQFALALTALAETLLNNLSINHAALEDVTAQVEPLINRAMQISPNLPDLLAARGWLLTEQFRFDQALPLLQRATELNPNDASSHRFLGTLYERRAQPGDALNHYSQAASLDPLDPISHVFRCLELVDLGDHAEATIACNRARELDPAHFWGPLATSWIPRAQGKLPEALQWLAAARKLAPRDAWLADQEIELLLTQGNVAKARAVIGELPADGDFYTMSREAIVEFAAGGPTALANWLKTHDTAKAATGAELIELARLQLFANDAVTARATLAHAEKLVPLSTADLFDASQFRYGYSAALTRAAIELKGGGEKQRAMKLLADLDRVLTTFERNGGEHFGMYSLRAESLALQGRKEEAAAALATAWKKGWRATWRARNEPYLTGIAIPVK